MKKILLITLFILAIFSSCKKEDLQNCDCGIITERSFNYTQVYNRTTHIYSKEPNYKFYIRENCTNKYYWLKVSQEDYNEYKDWDEYCKLH